MKILYLVSDFNLIGGKERYDQNIIRTLENLKESLKVLKLTGSALLEKTIFAIKAVFKTVFFSPNFIFCAHISFSPIVYFLKKVFRTPYVVFTHGIEVWDLKRDFYKKALLGADRVITVSKYTADKLIRQIPDLTPKIYFIKNTFDEKKFSITEKPNYLIKKHDLSGEPIILTVSRLYPTNEHKGYLRIIDAMPFVKKSFPRAKYIIVGSGQEGFGDNRERISNYAKEKGLAQSIILAGRVSEKELADYYNLCDVFVMPSVQEGFGIVFLEALSSGKPVVAGNKDGSRDTVLGGELGILVDPEKKEEIAEAIIQIFKNKADHRFYDRNFLRKRAIETYGYDVFKKSVVDLIKNLKNEI